MPCQIATNGYGQGGLLVFSVRHGKLLCKSVRAASANDKRGMNVRDVRRCPSRTLWFFLFSAVACLASGAATAACVVPDGTPAGTVPCKIVVQPIDVCADDGSLCAPFNQNSVIGNPSNQDQTTNPIGFVDQTTKINITRAMLNQIGIDVTFMSIVKYDSTTLLALRVIEDAANQTCPFPGGTMSGFTSCDLLTLSQQPDLSQVVGYMPAPPLASEPTVINMFFVSRLIPPTSQAGGTLYGFSWINNNGIAIGGNTFFPPSRARFDTLAHELGHSLALTHFDFGAGSPPNLAAVGGTPTGNFRIEPSSTGDALAQLDGGGGIGTADQLNLTSQESQMLPVSQQTEALLSGFVNPVPDSMVTAMEPATSGLVAAAATAGVSLTTSTGSRSSTSINFEVLGPVTAGGGNETLTALILMLPKGLKFDPRNPFHAYFNPEYVAETEILYGNNRKKENGFCVDPADFSQSRDDWDEHHRASATQCLLVEFKQPGLQQGQIVKFTIGIRIGGDPIEIDELAGGDITFIFGPDTYATTSALTGPVSGQLIAGSQRPDLRVPSRYVDPSKVTGTGQPPCTVQIDPSRSRRSTKVHTTGCPDPRMTGIEDGDPSHEGGQPSKDPYGRRSR
jgi:hypothetical protein